MIGSENLLMLVGFVLWFFNTLFYPLFYLLWLIKSSIVICYELLLPIFALIRILVMATWNLIWTVLNLPFVSLSFLFTSSYEGLLSLFALGTGLNQGAQQLGAVVTPLTQPDQAEATFGLI
jgi:hypothetical protein